MKLFKQMNIDKLYRELDALNLSDEEREKIRSKAEATQNRKPNIQKYLVAAIKKSLISKYTWDDSVSNKKIKHDVVSLPLKNTSDAKDYCLEDIDWD